MKFAPTAVTDRLGREIVLRNAEPEDAAALIEYLKITTAETPYLARESEDIKLSMEQEVKFINDLVESERELMLVGFCNGRHVGNSSLTLAGSSSRYRHRCGVAIALYREFCGAGIGEAMLRTILGVAKNTGFEQAELEVVAGNERAIALYRRLGFVEYGHFPDNMKYADGSYADALWMMKRL